MHNIQQKLLQVAGKKNLGKYTLREIGAFVGETSPQKIKREGPLTLELEPTADILKEISLRKQSQIVVGFAAETENVLENARQKLAAKQLHAIVVNDVSREGIGFDSDRNQVTIITRDQVVEVPETTKWEVAQRVLDQVVRIRQQRQSPVKA